MAVSNSSGLQPGSPLPYLFSIPGNAAFAAVYFALAVAHLVRFFLERRRCTSRGHKWSLCLPIAEIFMAAGFVLRLVLRSEQKSLGLYAVCNLFIILSPTAFIGFVYVFFSRFISALEGTSLQQEPKASRLSPLRSQLIGRIFIWSDVCTFLIQATGGGLQAVGGTQAVVGSNIFLAGVSLQAVSYVFFLVVVAVAHFKVARTYGQAFTPTNVFLGRSQVPRLFALLYVASVCILIRSIYRIIEMAGGYQGKVYRTENYLFFLDSLPLAVANTLWAVWWPPRAIRVVRDSVGEEAGHFFGRNVALEAINEGAE